MRLAPSAFAIAMSLPVPAPNGYGCVAPPLHALATLPPDEALEPDPAAPTRIVTIRGLGYKYERS